jgi:hypothetical protein
MEVGQAFRQALDESKQCRTSYFELLRTDR